MGHARGRIPTHVFLKGANKSQCGNDGTQAGLKSTRVWDLGGGATGACGGHDGEERSGVRERTFQHRAVSFKRAPHCVRGSLRSYVCVPDVKTQRNTCSVL